MFYGPFSQSGYVGGHHGEKVATVIQEIRFNILSILVLNVFFIKILKSFIYLSVLLI